MILSQNFQDIIHGAIYLAVNELNHKYLTCEHILFCALDNKNIIKMLEHFAINITQLRNKLYQFLQYDLYDLTNKNIENSRIVKLRFTDHLINFFERLILNLNNVRISNFQIEPEDFLLEILLDNESYSSYFLKKFNLNTRTVIEYLKEKNISLDTQGATNNGKKNPSGSKKINNFFDFDFDAGNNQDHSKDLNNSDFFKNNSKISRSNQNSIDQQTPGINSLPISYLNNLNDEKEKLFEKEKNKNSILENYCTNFNSSAMSNKIDPIFDRDEELSMLIKSLYCRRKGNALLIGDSGVGKTAIIEYLAQKIVNKDADIPKKLKSALIYSLDLNSLISGTRYRGDLEERMKLLMSEIENSKQRIILFIDEIHTVIGTGSTNNGTLDIGNILKPYLARSMIYCVGATTRKEFTQFLSKDKAFLRRFQIIYVNEPSIESAKKMISGIINKYETFHNVKYAKNSIEAAVIFCKRYISDRHLPDSALDIIDYAGSCASIEQEVQNQNSMNKNMNKNDKESSTKNLLKSKNSENNNDNKSIKIITKKDIEDVISQFTKIPKKQISSSGAKDILNLKSALEKKIIGQEHAIEEVCKSILVNKAGLSDEELLSPIASYIFYGPTGVGKTELAIQLAKHLNMHFIRIDMSEYSESHSVSKLFGAPPGYVGFEQNGLLTEQVLKNPYSVILLDEIEKAHSNLTNSLLQILDYGNLTDNFGQKVNFNHCIIICTTNTAARAMEKITPGFDSVDNKEITMRELENLFSPEFRNRFSNIIKFNHLSKTVVSEIIKNKFSKIIEKLKKKNIDLTIDSKIQDFIIEKKYNYLMGARIIDRIINDEINLKLAKFFLNNQVEKNPIKKILLQMCSINVDEIDIVLE